jgi:hypothetical protein
LVEHLTMTPERPYFILASNVPNFEVDFSKLDFLDIEAYSNEIWYADGYLPIVGIVSTTRLCQIYIEEMLSGAFAYLLHPT